MTTKLAPSSPPGASADTSRPVLQVVDEEPASVEPQPRDPGRRRHWEMLLVSLAVVALSLGLRLGDKGSVEVPVGIGWQLPPLCMSRAWLGVECPGCGLTRSFVSLAEGRVAQSYGYHRLGWLMAFAIVLQGPYRVYELSRPVRPVPERWKSWFGIALLFALVANWLLKTIGY